MITRRSLLAGVASPLLQPLMATGIVQPLGHRSLMVGMISQSVTGVMCNYLQFAEYRESKTLPDEFCDILYRGDTDDGHEWRIAAMVPEDGQGLVEVFLAGHGYTAGFSMWFNLHELWEAEQLAMELDYAIDSGLFYVEELCQGKMVRRSAHGAYPGEDGWSW